MELTGKKKLKSKGAVASFVVVACAALFALCLQWQTPVVQAADAHSVTIEKEPKEELADAYPNHLVVHAGDTITFENLTGEVVTLKFPAGLFDLKNATTEEMGTGGAAGKTFFTVPEEAIPDTYHYDVKGADGETDMIKSSPRIIVKPPSN